MNKDVENILHAVSINHSHSPSAITGLQSYLTNATEKIFYDQAITYGGQLILAHGLPSAPKHVHLSLVCQSDTDGYVAGQILPFGTSSLGVSQGISIIADAINLTIKFGNNLNVFNLLNANTGQPTPMDFSKWKVHFIATIGL